MILQQEKRIEELEGKVERKNNKIEELKLMLFLSFVQAETINKKVNRKYRMVIDLIY